MKLAAIYNIWDGTELLKGSMNCIKDDVDLFIIVWQSISNYGESHQPLANIDLSGYDCVLEEYIPKVFAGSENEKRKRNIGLDIARKNGCTHFLHLDTDEYYQDFKKAKDLFLASKASGSVCKLYTYFKEPTFRFEQPDNYFVPFIHELNADTYTGCREYPYYVDPTRRINEKNIVELPIFMYHFSWVRRDIYRKIRNSSAKNNINKSNLLADYNNPELKEGYFVADYRQKLIKVDNIFNINIV